MSAWPGPEVMRKLASRTSGTDEVFDADTLRDLAGDPDPSHAPNGTQNMIGNLFKEWHAAGLIEPVGYRKSSKPSRKRGLNRTWRGTEKAKFFL